MVLTSASCDLAMSTKALAAGCTISKVFKIVAPSFDIVAFPTIYKTGTDHMIMSNFTTHKSSIIHLAGIGITLSG